MIAAPLAADEAERLDALQRCQILDTPPEPFLDEILELATHLCATPIGMVTLVAQDRQWFKASTGVDVQETERSFSLCAHAILSDQIMVVENALTDERFADNPLVTDSPHIRFYAGAPLQITGGFRLGALCVIDTQPRTPTHEQLSALGTLRTAVVHQLELNLLRAAPTLICAWCKNVKNLQNDTGAWMTADEFVEQALPATHGMCPECYRAHEHRDWLPDS